MARDPEKGTEKSHASARAHLTPEATNAGKRVMAAPTIVRKLFVALDHQARFVEQLANVLEETGYDFAVIDAARALEDLFAELSAAAAEKMVQIRR